MPDLPYRDQVVEIIRECIIRKIPEGESSYNSSLSLLGAEVGVFIGDLSERILSTFSGVKLHLIDSWEEARENSDYRKSGDRMARQTQVEQNINYLKVVERTRKFRPQTVFHRIDSVEAAYSLLADYGPESFDFVFIDGDHSYNGVKKDLQAYYPLVRPGGLFSGHDYGHRRFIGVKRAVDEFHSKLKLKTDLNVGRGKVWWIWRP